MQTFHLLNFVAVDGNCVDFILYNVLSALNGIDFFFFVHFLLCAHSESAQNYKIDSLWGHHTDVKLNVAD